MDSVVHLEVLGIVCEILYTLLLFRHHRNMLLPREVGDSIMELRELHLLMIIPSRPQSTNLTIPVIDFHIITLLNQGFQIDHSCSASPNDCNSFGLASQEMFVWVILNCIIQLLTLLVRSCIGIWFWN
jgi:hypothetical protein